MEVAGVIDVEAFPSGVPIDERERDVQLLQHLESIEKCLVKEAKPKKKHKLPFLRRLFSTGSRREGSSESDSLRTPTTPTENNFTYYPSSSQSSTLHSTSSSQLIPSTHPHSTSSPSIIRHQSETFRPPPAPKGGPLRHSSEPSRQISLPSTRSTLPSLQDSAHTGLVSNKTRQYRGRNSERQINQPVDKSKSSRLTDHPSSGGQSQGGFLNNAPRTDTQHAGETRGNFEDGARHSWVGGAGLPLEGTEFQAEGGSFLDPGFPPRGGVKGMEPPRIVLHQDCGGFYPEEIPDVIIIYSSLCKQSEKWMKYFSKIILLNSGTRVRGQPVEEISKGLGQRVGSRICEERIYHANLQIMIVSPQFLDWVERWNLNIGRLIHTSKVLGLMLGVLDTDLTPLHFNQLRYSDWKVFDLKNEAENEEVTKQISTHANLLLQTCKKTVPSETTFRIFPRKINPGQNKILLILDTAQPAPDEFNVVFVVGNKVFHVEEYKLLKNDIFQIEVTDVLLSISTIATVQLFINRDCLGEGKLKIENGFSVLKEAWNQQTNPLKIFSETFGENFSSMHDLDLFLTSHLNQTNQTQDFDKTLGLNGETLLHWAAHLGFKNVALSLIHLGWGKQILVPNLDGMTPIEIAERAGFSDLASILRAGAEMGHDYQYPLVLSGTTGDTSTGIDGYLIPNLSNPQEFNNNNKTTRTGCINRTAVHNNNTEFFTSTQVYPMFKEEQQIPEIYQNSRVRQVSSDYDVPVRAFENPLYLTGIDEMTRYQVPPSPRPIGIVSPPISVPASNTDLSDPKNLSQTFTEVEEEFETNNSSENLEENPVITKDVATSCPSNENQQLFQGIETPTKKKSVPYIPMRPSTRKPNTVSESLLPKPLNPFPIQKSGSFGGFSGRDSEDKGKDVEKKHLKYPVDFQQHESRQELLSKYFSSLPRDILPRPQTAPLPHIALNSEDYSALPSPSQSISLDPTCSTPSISLDPPDDTAAPWDRIRERNESACSVDSIDFEVPQRPSSAFRVVSEETDENQPFSPVKDPFNKSLSSADIRPSLEATVHPDGMVSLPNIESQVDTDERDLFLQRKPSTPEKHGSLDHLPEKGVVKRLINRLSPAKFTNISRRNSFRSWRKSSEEPGRVSESSETERQEEETGKEEINKRNINEEEGKIKKEMEKQESKVGGNEQAQSEVGTSRLNSKSSVVWLPPKLQKSKTFPPVLSPCNASNLPLELSHSGASNANAPPVFSPSNASNVPSELSSCDASDVTPELSTCDASNVSQSLYNLIVPIQLNRRRRSEPWNPTKRKAPTHQTTNHPQGRVKGGFINQSFEEAQPDHKLDVNPNSWNLPKNKNFPVHRNQNRMTNNQAIVSDGVNAQCSIGENNMTDAENAQKKDVNSKMANY